jgi:hypothetical protein
VREERGGGLVEDEDEDEEKEEEEAAAKADEGEENEQRDEEGEGEEEEQGGETYEPLSLPFFVDQEGGGVEGGRGLRAVGDGEESCFVYNDERLSGDRFEEGRYSPFTCFTGAILQTLTQVPAGSLLCGRRMRGPVWAQVLTLRALLALLVQTHKY